MKSKNLLEKIWKAKTFYKQKEKTKSSSNYKSRNFFKQKFEYQKNRKTKSFTKNIKSRIYPALFYRSSSIIDDLEYAVTFASKKSVLTAFGSEYSSTHFIELGISV